MRTIGGRIKSLLAANGHTQAALARHLGLTPPAVGHYLADRRVPPVKQLKRIAAFLGVSVAELIDDTALITEDDDERDALEALRSLPPGQRAAALAFLKALSAQPVTTEDDD